MEISGTKYFMGEVQATVTVRRFYVGELESEDDQKVGLSHGFCMDEMRDNKGVQYIMIPDPMLFSDSISFIRKDKLISHKILDTTVDKDFINHYKENVTKFRAQNSGLVLPTNKVVGPNG